MNSGLKSNILNNPRFLGAMAGLAALAVSLPTLGAGFFLGDPRVVAEAGGSPFAGLSFLVDRSIWGMSPLGFHVTGALLHAANAMLVFAVGYFLLKRESPWPAFLGALLFALHPMNAEARSWISARGELIYTTFFLLSLVSYLNYAGHQRGLKGPGRQGPGTRLEDRTRGAAWLALTGTFFFLSLLGSEKALALAAVIPLFALALSGRPGGVLRRLAPAVGVCAAALVAFYVLVPLALGGAPELAVKNGLFDMGITPGLGYYAGKLVFPFGLDLYPQVPGSALYMLAGLALIASAAFLYAWGLRLEAFLVAWVVLALLPSFFVIDYSGAVLDERYLYLPAAAFALLLAAGISKIRSQPAFVAVSLVFVASYAVLSLQGASSWNGEGGLVAKALNKDGQSIYERPSQASYVLTKLGSEELEAGEYGKAMVHLREALTADDRNFMAYYQGGRLFERLRDKLGKEGDAEAQRALALEAVRVLKKGSENFPHFGYTHFQLGLWYVRLSLWGEAEAALTKAVMADPENQEAAALLKLTQALLGGQGLHGSGDEAEIDGMLSFSGRNDDDAL
jgi:tetratricopeptide (TPR) repeat protein